MSRCFRARVRARVPFLIALALGVGACSGPSGEGGTARGTTPRLGGGQAAARRAAVTRGSADLALGQEALSKLVPDYRAALLSFERALKVEPSMREARLNAAFCLLRLDRLPEAEAAFRVAAAKAGDREALLGWVDVLLRLGSFAVAERAISAWLESHPADLQVLSLAAALHRRQGAHEKALRRVQQGLTVDRKDPLAHIQFGMLYLDRKDARTALMIFNRGLLHHQRHAGLLLGRGLAWQALGETGRAVMDFEAAVKEDGGLVAGRLLLGKVYVDNLDFDGARRHFGAVLVAWPRHKEALLGSARTLFGKKQFKESLAGYQAAVREHGEEPRALFQIAKLYQDHLDSPQEALQHYERFVKAQPGLTKDDPVFATIKMLKSMTRATKAPPPSRRPAVPAPGKGVRP